MRESVNSRRGLARLIAATGHSFRGFQAAWQSEEAFRQEAVLAVALVPAAFWVGQTMTQRVLLIAAVLLVVITELLNTAVEYTVDRIGTDHHDLSGRAKDIGSAAVMTALLLWLVVWIPLVYVRLTHA